MKKILFYISAAFLSLSVNAQSPQGINYQAALRNNAGNILASQLTQIRFSIHDSIPTGTIVFQETQTLTTTAQGILNAVIGAGTAVTGTLSGVNWAVNTKYLEVEVNTGSGYTSLGSQQMVSVPYALYAGSAGNMPFTVNGNNIYNNNTGNVGINTTTPAAKLHITGSNEMIRNQMNGLAWQSFYYKQNYMGYIGTWTDTADLDLGTSGSGRNVHLVTSATPRLTVAQTGNVGIGTTNPANFSKLHVSGIGSNSSTVPMYSTTISATTDPTTGGVSSGIYAEGTWRGVFGRNKGTVSRNGAMAVYGLMDSATNYNSAYGVYGDVRSTGNTGSSNFGVYGVANNGVAANYSVYGANSGTRTVDYAGYFNGRTFATNFSATTKAFKIDHPLDPENKYLQHSCVESNDMMNIYNGNAQTDAQGEATVQLPEYFTALNNNFKYQLTCIGQFAQAIVLEEIENNHFKIKTDKPNVKVSWMVTGVRHDAAANYYRIQTEVQKAEHERGKFLTPEAFGHGAERGTTYQQQLPNNGTIIE